jgi:hypothetical protein
VQTYDSKPKRRLFEVLAGQGMQPNQQVTFLTDGGEDIRDLPRYLNPQAEHLLDWFHLTMRITVLTQQAKGLRCAPETLPDVAAQLQRVKWFLWHGNVFRARQTVDDLRCDGVPAARTYYCRSAPASSTTPSPTTTDAGTPASPTPTVRTRPNSLPRFVPLS